MSRRRQLVWVVNPGDDTVSVIRTDTNQLVKNDHGRRRAAERRARPEQPLRLRRQRRRQHASPSSGSRNAEPRAGFRRGRRARRSRPAPSRGTSSSRPTAGASSSPTAARTRSPSSTPSRAAADHRQRRPAQQPLQRPRPRPPLPAARPGGDAEQQAAVRHALPVVHQARRPAGRRQRQGGRGLPPQHQHEVQAASRDYRPAPADHARAAGHRLHRSTPTATACPTRPPRSRTSSRASSSAATRPTCRTSPPRPTGPLRFNVDTQAFVNVDRRRATAPAPTRAPASSSTCTSARATPSRARRSSSSPTPGRSRSRTRAAPATAYVVSAGSDLLVKVNVDGRRQARLHGRRRHDALHRPERPGQPGHQRRERRQEPAGHRRSTSAGTRAYVHELRLAQRLGRRPRRPTRS